MPIYCVTLGGTCTQFTEKYIVKRNPPTFPRSSPPAYFSHVELLYVLDQGCPTALGKFPRQFLWAGSRATRVKSLCYTLQSKLLCNFYSTYTYTYFRPQSVGNPRTTCMHTIPKLLVANPLHGIISL